MRLTFLSTAIWDLTSIRAYIAADNPAAAQRVGQRLREIISGLIRFPGLGKPGRVPNTRELVTSKIGKTAYVVVYRVRIDRVEVLRVLAGVRNLDQILEAGFPEEEN